MFVPFVFTLDPSDDHYYLWIFYKFLNMAKKYNSPIIAQERYFINPAVFIQSGLSATRIEAGKINEYDIPTSDDMYKIQKYPILKKIEEELIKEYGSQTAAWLYLLKQRSTCFEEYIGVIIDDIIEKNTDTIEGIFTFINIPSLSYIAEQRNIPIVQLEWGPFRGPVYRKTAYMNFGRINEQNELKNRYVKFTNEVVENSVCFLSRKEILSMFLDYKFIDNINLIDFKPEYEMGIACTYTIEMNQFANSSFLNNLEIITMAKRYYNEKVLSIRLHPTDPARAKPSGHLVDNSPTPMHFINLCKRICVINSNMAFEAMLWGRTAYVLGNSPYDFIAQRNLSIINESVVDLEFVNYVTFAYLIPYELMLDVEYLRWRLTNPTEVEIYNYNLNYYLSCRGIKPSILEESGVERLKKMLLAQGFDLSGRCVPNDENTAVDVINSQFNSSMQLNIKIQYLENKITALNMKHEELETTYRNQCTENAKLWEVHQNIVKKYAQKCDEYEQLAKESAKLWENYENLTDVYSRNLDNLKNIEQQRDTFKLRYDTISNSASWKITAPIRYFLNKIKGK